MNGKLTKTMHALTRTSPKGQPFLGTCMKCGRKNLPASAVNDECDNPARLTEEDTLLLALGRTAIKQGAGE